MFQKAQTKVLRVIELGPTAQTASISDIIEQVNPSVPEPDWNLIYERLAASARRAILRKQEEEDEEDAVFLLLH